MFMFEVVLIEDLVKCIDLLGVQHAKALVNFL